MLVDVIRMRSGGVKLPKDVLNTARAVRGTLLVADRFDAHRGRQVLMATLSNDQIEYALPVLDYVRLGPLRGDSFVLYGIEEIAVRKLVSNHPQAWWCRLAWGTSKDMSWPRTDDDDEPREAMLDAASWTR